MNKIQKRRFILISLLIAGISTATGLILFALKQNMNVFVTPTQILANNTPSDAFLRLGGIVKPHSLVYRDTGIQFVVTDNNKDMRVEYHGVLPDLFHEGKGIIVEGHLSTQHIFIASLVLAKHDENYTPMRNPS